MPSKTYSAIALWDAASDVSRRALIVSLGAAAILPGAWAKSARAETARRRVIDIRIKNGRVISPKGAIRATQGDVVELHWTSNTRVRLHIHGYDRKLEVLPGKTTKIILNARVAGRFPIERHGGGHGEDTLTYLEVYPR